MLQQFTIDNADNEQSGLFKLFGDLNKGKNYLKKYFFQNNVNILLKLREDDLNGFKNKTFSINEIFNITLYATPYTSPDATHRLTRRKTSRLNKTILKKIQIKSEIKMIKKYKQ